MLRLSPSFSMSTLSAFFFLILCFGSQGPAQAEEVTPAPVAPSEPGFSDGEERRLLMEASRAASRQARRKGLATPVLNVDTGATFVDLQSAVDAAGTLAGHTLEITASLAQGLVTVSKDLTLRGAGGSEVVSAAANTGSSGDARAWFLVSPGVDLTVRDLTFDGAGFKIYQAFRHRGTGLFENVSFRNIQFDASGPSYAGSAVVAFGGRVDVRQCTFSNIGRVGVLAFGTGMSGAELVGNTYVGKGPGDFLDYGIEVGGGAVVILRDNHISACRGVASADGSASAAVLATTVSAPGTFATVTGNTLLDNTFALRTGNTGDTSTLVARFNRIVSNDDGAAGASSAMSLEHNWWGCNAGPGAVGCDTVIGGHDADPWLVLGLAGASGLTPFSSSPYVASLTFDSAGADTAGAGTVPDGIPATFAAAVGSMAPPVAATSSGTATSLFSAGATGLDTVQVTVDGETVSLAVDVDPSYGPVLDIDDAVPARVGERIGVPIRLISGTDIASVAFSVDMDQSCLAFDATDGDLDGIPDDAVFDIASLPYGPSFGLTYDGADTASEFQVFIADFGLPPLHALPTDVLLTLYFTVTCTPPSNIFDVSVDFADDPDASFGNTAGQSVPGTVEDGFVRVYSGLPGDCNGDGMVDAGDLSACPLEIFDGDGDFWADVPGSTFVGDPVGCDANEDGIVDAGDSSCKVLLIFNGQGACDGAARTSSDLAASPSLTVRPYGPVEVGDTLRVWVDLRHGGDVNSLAAALDYDSRYLELDPRDEDGDGRPDAVQVLTAGLQARVAHHDDTDTGRLELSLLKPFEALTSGALVEILFTVREQPPGERTPLVFGVATPSSYGSLDGASRPGTDADNSVWIPTGILFADGFESGDPSRWGIVTP